MKGDRDQTPPSGDREASRGGVDGAAEIEAAAMGVGRRRGRAEGLRGVLVERERELGEIHGALEDARAGAGSVLLVEAPAGEGKSRLLSVAGDLARQAGMQVLGASATELEREFPYGVAVQLLEPLWTGAGDELRVALTAGPAQATRDLLDHGFASAGQAVGGEAFALIHALTWMVRNLAGMDEDPSGVLMLIDDLQWADVPSLRFLAYLAERIADLPVALLTAVRSGESVAEPRALRALRAAAGRDVLRPGPLSYDGVTAVVRSRMPAAAGSFIRACARVTAGNPFLLIRLLDQVQHDQLAPDTTTARALASLTPAAVLEAVIARLGTMSPETVAISRALSVLGDGSPVSHVAQLAGVEMGQAVAAADMLAALHLLTPGAPLSFAHPLIRSAVHASIPPLDRADSHRRAAVLLGAAGAPAEHVAAQLMHAPPGGDAAAQQTLLTAAARAMAGGACESAVRMLERALAEAPESSLRHQIEVELALARAAAEQPGAIEQLHETFARAPSGPERTRVALALTQALIAAGRRSEAQAAISELEPPPDGSGALADEFDATLISAARVAPALRPRALERARQLHVRAGSAPTDLQRRALAEAAHHCGLAGRPRAEVLELIDRAWHVRLLPGSRREASWRPLCNALLFIDELDRDLELIAAAIGSAPGDELSLVRTVAASTRAEALYAQGQISAALSESEAALVALPENWSHVSHIRVGYAILGLALTQRGELERAETALSILDHPDILDSPHVAKLLVARARLRLAQLRPQDACEDALTAGRWAEELGVANPGAVPWRSAAAQALLMLGEPGRARRLAAQDLEVANEVGGARMVIAALRSLGLAERGKQQLARLREAAELAESYPQRLESIEALVALGAALRRGGQRAAAREPLRRAVELARAGGAARLAAAARTELAATGVSARRMLIGGVASLTPSEQRVAELAAAGHTTREMAEVLFVTRKTIEYHLRQIYRKLEISSRQELPAALSRPEDS